MGIHRGMMGVLVRQGKKNRNQPKFSSRVGFGV